MSEILKSDGRLLHTSFDLKTSGWLIKPKALLLLLYL